MREMVIFQRHGTAASGTLRRSAGGYSYGYPRTTLFAPTLASDLAHAQAARFYGLGAGDSVPKGPVVDAAPGSPPLVSVTTPTAPVLKDQARAANAQAQSDTKAAALTARIHAAIAKGKVPAAEAAARAQSEQAHAERLELAVHGAYNAIAILQAKINAERAAGKSQAAHQRVLNKLRARTDALADAIARSHAAAVAIGNAVGGAPARGMFMGFGAEEELPATDAMALEEEAAVAVADAANAISAGDLPAAETALDTAGSLQNQAVAARDILAASGDFFAQLEQNLQPGMIPWRTIGMVAALIALARAVTR